MSGKNIDTQCVNLAKKMLFLTFFLLLSGSSRELIAADPLPASDSSAANQVVMKVQEATFPVTEENGATKHVMIVSKIYDAKDSYGNSYIVRHVGRNGAIVIDPGYNYEAIIRHLKSKDYQLEAILLTNGYFARMAGNAELKRHWPDAKILIGEADAKMLTDIKANMSEEFGGVTSPKADILVRDGDQFNLAGIRVWAISTPGHTPGSTCYMIDSDKSPIVFTGDFIYKDGISSGGFPVSNQEDMQKSLQAFFESQYAETVIFSGYGDDTTVGAFYEKLTGTPVDAVKTSTTIQTDAIPKPVLPPPQAVTTPDSNGSQPSVTNVIINNSNTVYVPPVQYVTSEILLTDFSYPWFGSGIVVRVPFVTFWGPVWPRYYVPYMPPRTWSFRIGPYPYPTYFYPYSSRSYRNRPPFDRNNPYRDRRDYDTRVPVPRPDRSMPNDRGGYTPPIYGVRPGSGVSGAPRLPGVPYTRTPYTPPTSGTHPGSKDATILPAPVSSAPGIGSGPVRDRMARPGISDTRPGSVTPGSAPPGMTPGTIPNRPAGNKPSPGGTSTSPASTSSGSVIPRPDFPGRGTRPAPSPAGGDAKPDRRTDGNTTRDNATTPGTSSPRATTTTQGTSILPGLTMPRLSTPRSTTPGPATTSNRPSGSGTSETGSNEPGHDGRRK